MTSQSAFYMDNLTTALTYVIYDPRDNTVALQSQPYWRLLQHLAAVDDVRRFDSARAAFNYLTHSSVHSACRVARLIETPGAGACLTVVPLGAGAPPAAEFAGWILRDDDGLYVQPGTHTSYVVTTTDASRAQLFVTTPALTLWLTTYGRRHCPSGRWTIMAAYRTPSAPPTYRVELLPA